MQAGRALRPRSCSFTCGRQLSGYKSNWRLSRVSYCRGKHLRSRAGRRRRFARSWSIDATRWMQGAESSAAGDVAGSAKKDDPQPSQAETKGRIHYCRRFADCYLLGLYTDKLLASLQVADA